MSFNEWLPIPSHQGQYPYDDVERRQRAFSVTPDKDTSIMMLHAEPGFVQKDGVVPFLYPVLLLGAPLSPRVSVLQCQGTPQQWSAHKQSVLQETSSHCLCGYLCCKQAYFQT